MVLPEVGQSAFHQPTNHCLLSTFHLASNKNSYRNTALIWPSLDPYRITLRITTAPNVNEEMKHNLHTKKKLPGNVVLPNEALFCH